MFLKFDEINPVQLLRKVKFPFTLRKQLHHVQITLYGRTSANSRRSREITRAPGTVTPECFR